MTPCPYLVRPTAHDAGPTRPVRAMTRTALTALVLGLLAACGGGGAGSEDDGGGGGGGGPGTEQPAPAPSATVVLVDPLLVDDLDDLVEDYGAVILGPVEGTSYWRVQVPSGMTVAEFLALLQDDDDDDDGFDYDDLDEDEGVSIPEGGGSTVPIFLDEGFDAVTAQVGLQEIGVAAARARGLRGAGVIVAVIDTGVDATHPLLAGRVLPGWDFVDEDGDAREERNGLDDDGDGLVDEGYGHGTFVASLVLAVAPDASILPLRVLNSDSFGTASAVARAFAYAVAQGAHVINFSAGLPREVSVVAQAASNADSAGVALVAAAGNRNLSSVDYPANHSSVLAVSGVTSTLAKASFASYGSDVDLVAPAVNLRGAHPGAPSRVARWSGTSFSTALVSGALALLRSGQPAADTEDLLDRLLDTARPVDAMNPSFAGRLGAGRVDLDAASAP